jgi:putative ABC transport system permease protein
MSLGVALVVTVLVIYAVIDNAFQRSTQGYNLIVGPKGSKTDLVLSTAFYINSSDLETIPYGLYRDIYRKFPGEIDKAIPVALGEPYKGAPVVATKRDFFEELRYGDKKPYVFRYGENFAGSDYRGAVLGYNAARRLKLKVGEKISLLDGAENSENADDVFTVRGILRFSGTPNDQAVFINLEGFYEMNESRRNLIDRIRKGEKEDTPTEEQRTLSAILVLTKKKEVMPEIKMNASGDQPSELVVSESGMTSQVYNPSLEALPRLIEEDKEYHIQAVSPTAVVTTLFDKVIGNIRLVLVILACLVIVVAGIGMMVSIYNTMNERRHEIAIMRALGAKRRTVMMVILFESILLSLAGGVVGFVLGHSLIGILSPWISESLRVPVSAFQLQGIEVLLIPGLTLLASIVGYLPAVMAYRTDVAESL